MQERHLRYWTTVIDKKCKHGADADNIKSPRDQPLTLQKMFMMCQHRMLYVAYKGY